MLARMGRADVKVGSKLEEADLRGGEEDNAWMQGR